MASLESTDESAYLLSRSAALPCTKGAPRRATTLRPYARMDGAGTKDGGKLLRPVGPTLAFRCSACTLRGRCLIYLLEAYERGVGHCASPEEEIVDTCPSCFALPVDFMVGAHCVALLVFLPA